MLRASFIALLLLTSLATSLANSLTTSNFFEQSNQLLKTYVKAGRVDYIGIKADNAIAPLVKDIANINLDKLGSNERKAYLINAYNLLVIHQVIAHYPLKSVLDIKGFFDANKFKIGGQQMTLNQLEKELLLKQYDDARLHFVLVCGAVGCPPLTNFAYVPSKLEQQLEQQTRLALNNDNFIRANGSTTALSKIFEWYAKDFGDSKANVLAFINRYRKEKITSDSQITYYTYDWNLNNSSGRTSLEKQLAPLQTTPEESSGGGNNSSRYVVSAAIPKGTFEIKIFNNLYSQEAEGQRASFFTALTSVLYGISNRVNVGFDLRYRNVRYDEAGTASNFDVFSSKGANYFRNAITGFGPKVRIAPFKELANFSIQSALWLPVADNPSGVATGENYIDWEGPTWWTQFFNDFPIGSNFSFFAEIDVLLEDIGSNKEQASNITHSNRLSTPVVGILSYFPNPKTTLYGLAGYSPYWQEKYDYFYQLGLGAKYQFTPKLELELLATAFDNQYLNRVNGKAGTLNFGLRFNI